MLFGLDLALTNGSIIEQELGHVDRLPEKEQHKLTKANFALGYATEVLERATTMRQRMPAGMCIMQAQMTNSAEYLSPASVCQSKVAEHELVDMGVVTRAQGYSTKKGRAGRKTRKSIPNGTCAYDGCPKAKGIAKAKSWAKRPQTRCQACHKGRGAYYHMPCFFATHRCYHGKPPEA